MLFEDFTTSIRHTLQQFPSPFFFVGARYDIAIENEEEPVTVYSAEYFDRLRDSDLVTKAVLHSFGGVESVTVPMRKYDVAHRLNEATTPGDHLAILTLQQLAVGPCHRM